jgi:multicomponent Na+:H+ antiporter subunit F
LSPSDFLQLAAAITQAAFALALVLTVVRIVLGPTLPDRIVALDLLVGIVLGLIATFTVRTGYDSYLDVAIALGLVGFLATVAFARFVLRRGRSAEGDREAGATAAGGRS